MMMNDMHLTNRAENFTARLCQKFRLVLLASSLVMALPLWDFSVGTADAQTIADSFGGLSRKNNEPINIEADTLEVLDDKKYALFSGNVKVKQGKFHLASKKLKVTYSGSVGGKQKKSQARGIKWIEASGKVAITTPDAQSATADWAKFDVLSKTVTIGGHVILSQNGNVMKGDKLVIDLKTNRSKFYSTSRVKGVFKGNKGTKGKKPRISGVFYPGRSKGKNPFGASPSKKKTAKQKPRESSGPPLPWKKSQ